MKNQLKRTMDYQVRELSLKYLEAVGGPVAEHLCEAIRAEDWRTIIGTKINPRLYDSFTDFERDYLACELLRKYPGFPIDLDRDEAARESFRASELTCWRTNRRLYPYVDLFGDLDEGVLSFIKKVRKKVESIIGSKPPEITDHCDFGPGATYDRRGKHVLAADKIESKPTRTKDLFSDVAHLWIYGQTKWGASHHLDTVVVLGNRFTTVPKNSEINRGICIEPTLNVYIQKGYGQALRRCLKRVNVDLDEGQRRNGSLAQWASDRGDYCTIDLSSASDTVSRSLVELLLPKAWYEALDSARSKYTLIGDRWVRLEKFSSMGNGFTFELETLIFAAICSSIVDSDLGEESLGSACFVYGDDIIVPTKLFRDCVAALSFFGFSVNSRKTFHTGFFRESCGTDAFGGQVVRPLRIDSIPDGPEWWMSCANGITRAIAARLGPYNGAWRYCISQLPLAYRKLRGPERLGDIVVHDPNWVVAAVPAERLKAFGKNHKYSPGTFWTKALVTVTHGIPWKHWSEPVELSTRLLRVGDNSTGHTGRGCPTTRMISWVSVS